MDRTIESREYGSSCRHGITTDRSGATCAPKIVVQKRYGDSTMAS